MRLACLLLAAGAMAWAEAPLRILFLGNSYTYYHHLAGIAEGLAHAVGGRAVEARSVTLGGATLEQLYFATNALEVLRGERWDLVVLQEQSSLGLHTFNGDAVINDPAAFHAWARVWDAEIRRNGARTVFLNTWARKGRSEMQAHLDWAYAAIARELGAGLIPAGRAFQSVTDIDLYQPDGGHPSAAGSYLAACAAVEILTAGDCLGAPPEIAGVPMDNQTGRLRAGERGPLVALPADVAARLQAAAIGAVRQLQSEGGYWRGARPEFAGEGLGGRPGAKAGMWQGRWSGTAWFYGRKASITLQLKTEGTKCQGTWSVSAEEPPTQATMSLENCSVEADRLRYAIRPLFWEQETHEAWMEGDRMQGVARLQSPSAYHRQEGTWTLQRMAQ